MQKRYALLVLPGKYGSIFPEIPLQLLYIASALSEVGIPSRILDLRLDVPRNLNLKDVLFVGISTKSDGAMVSSALDFAQMVRETAPEVPLVWGGIHPSLLPEQTLRNPYVDVVVCGEGEETIKELAQAIKDGSDLSGVRGVAYKEDGRIHMTPMRNFMDMDNLSIHLPYDDINMDRYIKSPFPVHTSRGCPFRCGFCYNVAFGKRKWRCKSSERVVDEVEYVVNKFGMRHISFTWEDEFFISRRRVEEVCRGLLDRNINIRWDSFCRLEHFAGFEDEFIRLVERSGCNLLSFGAESGSQRLLDLMQKGIRTEHIVRTTEKLAKSSIKQVISFMSGLPTETYEDMLTTFDLIDELVKINPRITIVGIFFYTPYPGTPLFELVRTKYGYNPPGSLDEWRDFGIYRNVECTWLTREYASMMKALSIMTRFPFYTADYGLPERVDRFPFRPVYELFAVLARQRWKRRFFKYPLEWLLLEKGLQHLRGFV